MLFITACEIEKTEYESILDNTSFSGFENDYFIIHNQSISYYSPKVNRIYPDIYAYQNGKHMGHGIHSFHISFRPFPGLITFQKDNKIEFIDVVNFISGGFLEIEKPRDITEFNGQYCMVSFGDKSTGGIVLVDIYAKKIIKVLHTAIEAGKIYKKENYLYVFSDGYLINDSIIEQFYYLPNSPNSMHKLDSFSIGIRPVDFVEMTIHYDDYDHEGLAILCKGNTNIPASIVLFDLITEKVTRTYPFESTNIIPENLFWFPDYWTWFHEDQSRERILASYINNKLYTLTLNNPVELSVLINKNISYLIPSDDYYLAVSRDTIASTSNLYRFDRSTLGLVDSISINAKAIKLVGRGY
jgi:hypothetical protein